MQLKSKKIMLNLIILLLLFIVIFQFIKIERTRARINSLQSSLIREKAAKERLEQKYLKTRTEKIDLKQEEAAAPITLKEMSRNLLAEIENFRLQLIDFNTAAAEMNLNLRGDFSSIIDFMAQLETKNYAAVIREFKIKKSGGSLFFFLKLDQENRDD